MWEFFSVLSNRASNYLPSAPIVNTPSAKEKAKCPPLKTTEVVDPRTGDHLATLIEVHRDPAATHTTVAVLGQCYDGDNDLKGEVARLGKADIKGNLYLVHWTKTCPVPAAVKGLKAWLLKCMPWRKVMHTVVAQCATAEGEAARIGSRFDQILRALPEPVRSLPISLYAHSMGAALLSHGLSESRLDHFSIDRAVFLGGTTPRYLPHRAFANMRGNIFNFYRNDDWILGAVEADTGKHMAGHGPMGTTRLDDAARLMSVSLPDVGHRYYWNNINGIMAWIAGYEAGARAALA